MATPSGSEIRSTDEKEETESLHTYTEVSKRENAVGSGIVIFESG